MDVKRNSDRSRWLSYAPDSASEGVDGCCSAARLVGVRTTGLCVVAVDCGCGTSDGSSGSIVSSNGVFMPPPLIVERRLNAGCARSKVIESWACVGKHHHQCLFPT